MTSKEKLALGRRGKMVLKSKKKKKFFFFFFFSENKKKKSFEIETKSFESARKKTGRAVKDQTNNILI